MQTTEIEIEFAPTQRKKIGQLSGIKLPKSLNIRLAELTALAMAAKAAGRTTLPLTPSAVNQMLPNERQSLEGAGLFSVQVELTAEQRERIKQATGMTMSTLLIVPDD